MKISKILSEIFCPSKIKCIFCGGEVFEESKYCLCSKCELPINDEYCHSCGVSIMDITFFCDVCKERPRQFTMARAPLIYHGNLINAIHRLKYGDGQFIAKILATIMAEEYVKYDWEIDEVTFVPMHKKRLRSRGYNQAELLASEFGKIMNLPVVDCLERVKYTKNLARMNKRQRAEAIAGTIEVKKKPAKRMLIIDDVFTTGATIEECAKVLKKAGAKTVYVLTAATSELLPMVYMYITSPGQKPRRLTRKRIKRRND